MSNRKSSASARAELDMIASALEDAPVLDRLAQQHEPHPYNSIASTDVMQRTLLRIVRRREPQNQWFYVYRALERTDDHGDGFNVFMDAYRDAAFQAGVEYAARSLPKWYAAFAALSEAEQDAIGVLVGDRVGLAQGVK